MIKLNPDKTFATRPGIGQRFRCATTGKVHTVAASWAGGVVFEDEKICSAFDLVKDYDPQCPECKGFHEPDYPHDLSTAFRLHILGRYGRKATTEDTYAHCPGLLREAIAAANA